jgi:hypothetical protein
MAVQTSKVQNRRRLHFDTIEDILHEVEKLNAGEIKTLGNWSGGQILKHLATLMDHSIDGSPMRLGWPMRMLGRMLKRRILSKGMTPGVQLKGQAADAMVPPPTTWEEGMAIIRKAARRIQAETKREPSPFFGSMTRDEWDRLHCRHAELHLSFLVPA